MSQIKDMLNLAAVVMDEAENIAKLAGRTPEEQRDLEVHAVRAQSLYRKMCDYESWLYGFEPPLVLPATRG